MLKITKKPLGKGGGLTNLLNKDVKELNGIILSLVCISFLLIIGIVSYKINSSYAIFTDTINGKKTIEIIVANSLDSSGANKPVLSENMIPVYYDEENEVWRKADSQNKNPKYKWYDYDNKMWANSVTVSQYQNVGEEVEDYSDNNINAEVIGNPTYTNEGLKLDGTDDALFIASDLKDLFKNSNTIQIKVKRSETNARDVLIGNYNVSNNINYEINTSNQYRLFFNAGASDLVGGTVSYNKFVLISYVFDKANNTIKVYEDSTLKHTFTYSGYSTYNYDFNSVYIGRDSRTGATALNGTIEKVMIYQKALNLEEISNNIDTTYQEIGTNNNGIVSDGLKLYYDFRSGTREDLVNAKLGTEIPMKDILTMQVWIPRYKYTIWNYNADGTVASEPQEINIQFEKGTTTSGEISCSDTISGTDGTNSETCKLKTNNETCTDNLCNGKTYTHPAFTFGSEELTGFWIGKFEVSANENCTATDYDAPNTGCNLSTLNAIVKPSQTSWRGIQVARQANNLMNMNETNNKYGFTISDDTHMIKNMEWGAVSYLSHSNYGENSEIEINANSNYTTGCGPTEYGSTTVTTQCSEYNTILGQKSSTTGNIYGVYDMAGGSWEQTMSAIISSDGQTMMTGNNNQTTGSYKYANSDFTGMIYNNTNYISYTGNYSFPNEKYYDKYSFGTSYTQRNRSKLGDAIKEIYNEGEIGWYEDYGHIGYDYSPWILRGGYHGNLERTGIFASSNYIGYSVDFSSTRLVISQP